MVLIKKTDDKAKLMFDGIKIYVRPHTQSDKWEVRSAQNRQLTPEQAKLAVKIAYNVDARFANEKFVNNSCPKDYTVVK